MSTTDPDCSPDQRSLLRFLLLPPQPAPAQGTGDIGESDPDPRLEEALGWWDSRRRLGCLSRHRVCFVTANAPRVWWVHSQAQILAPQPTSCVTLGIFLYLSVPRLPHRPNEDSTGTSSWDAKDIQPAGTEPTPGLVLPPSPPQEQSCHSLSCSDTWHRAVTRASESG